MKKLSKTPLLTTTGFFYFMATAMSNKQTKQKEEKNTFGLEAFNILKQAEEGIRVELTLPDGTETGQFLTVRGADSKQFKKAKAVFNRERMNRMKTIQGKTVDDALEAVHQDKATTKLISSLVVGWSFDEECTTEAVITFLISAPQIQEQIDSVAGERSNFFVNPSTV